MRTDNGKGAWKGVRFWQRTEVLCTYEQERFQRTRELLTAHGIDYDVRIKSATHSVVPFGRGTRNVQGNLGAQFGTQYYVYVKKEQLEEAQFVLRSL